MKPKEVRHGRIVELRNMFLRGGKREDLLARCVQWNVSIQTANSYIDEVANSIRSRMK